MSIKEATIDLLHKLPDDCLLEDIQYELYFKTKVEKGLEDVKNNEVLSEEEMDEEIKSWQN
jgi:predicted transcriptional regulator